MEAWKPNSLQAGLYTVDCFKPFLGSLHCDTTVTEPFSTQVCKWVPDNLMLGWRDLCGGLISHSVETRIVRSRCGPLSPMQTSLRIHLHTNLL